MKNYLDIKSNLSGDTKKNIFETSNNKYRAHIGTDRNYYLTDWNDFSKVVLMMTPEFYKIVFEHKTKTRLNNSLPLPFSLSEDNRCMSVILAPNKNFDLFFTDNKNYCVADRKDQNKIYMYVTNDLWDIIFEKE